MKKQIILAGLIAIVNVALAQVPWSGTSLSGNTHRTGNVGIGNTSPAKSLDILSGIANDGIMIKQTTSGHATLRMDNGSAGGLNYGFCSTGYLSQEGAGHFFLYDHSNYRYRIFFNSNGNVGIGDNLTSPQYKLDISSAQLNDGINITQIGTSSSALHLTNTSTGGKHWALFSTGSSSSQQAGNFSIYDYNAGIDRFFISSYGNVGIGTNAPDATLDIVQNSSQNRGIKFSTATTGNPAFEIINPSTPTYSKFKTYGNGQTFIGTFNSPGNDFNANGSMLTIGHSGANNKIFNIVDNTNPSSLINLFAVFGNGRAELYTSGINTGIKIEQTGNTAATLRLGHSNSTEGNWALMSFGSGTGEGASNFGIYDQNALQTRIFISGSGANIGNVGIGTNSPTAKLAINGNAQIGAPLASTSPHFSTYSLSVKGKIVANEIIVTQLWADYVFAKNYKLNSLEYVESYIKNNHHLPNVPSAAEVEINGVNLGEISKIQMEKIEELTLYVIELKKELDTVKKELKNK